MSSPAEDDPSPPAPKRRRSSLLTRKSIGIGSIALSKEVADKQYICEASQEIQEWRALYKERKQSSIQSEKALAEITLNPPAVNYETVKGDLTQEDKNFLAQRPDYARLIADADSCIAKFSVLQRNVEKLKVSLDSELLLCQSRQDSIAKDICTFNENTPILCNVKFLN